MLQTAMQTLAARYLERIRNQKKRESAEKSFTKLTYRGVPYCKPCESKDYVLLSRCKVALNGWNGRFIPPIRPRRGFPVP